MLGAIAAKATIGTVGAVLLAATTPFPAVLRGLEQLRVPRALVQIASFMYRYLFVIVEELGRMRAALAARAYRPRHLLDAAPLGRVATAMFLRTYGRGERVYLAMLARGYDGRMPELEPLRLRAADLAFVALVLAVLLPLPGRRMSCAIRLRDLRYSLPRRAAGAPRRRPRGRARRAHRPARAQRRGQDHADAPPQRAHVGSGGARDRGRRRRPRHAARAAPARRGRVPGSRRPAVHADRDGGRGLRAAEPRARRRRGARAGGRGARTGPDDGRGGARAPPALDGRAAARGDRHGARDAPAAARARRAVGQPRPARTARAARDPCGDRAHDGARHA